VWALFVAALLERHKDVGNLGGNNRDRKKGYRRRALEQ